MTRHYIYRETTEWTDSNGANHIYIFLEAPKGRTARAVGYIPAGGSKVQKLKQPMTLDLKARSFEAVT